jgi:hypothetical protein
MRFTDLDNNTGLQEWQGSETLVKYKDRKTENAYGVDLSFPAF